MITILKYILLIISFLNISFVYAQIDKANSVYLSTELNKGNYFGSDINLNFVFNDNISFTIGYFGASRKSSTLPSDYSAGLEGLITFGLKTPIDEFNNFQFGLGKIINLNRKETLRLNMIVGFGYSFIKEPYNWQKLNVPLLGFLSENYLYDINEINAISLTINPKLEIPIKNFYGLTLSPLIHINKQRSIFGIGIGTMIGYVKKK